MSLAVHQLTKIYGQQKAVDAISFSVGQGEIVGFLGPNGAGKSTTMKIATGYIPATSGDVVVNGLNVAEQPMQVKKNIGYLPEHNPLYLDMYVHEYLNFIGKVYQIPSAQLKARVREMIALCGLEVEQHKLIGLLSKGYRQRVGLAQALVHNPPVLILDEPTTGLDPNQIMEIRKLIKEVSQNKTVIFSTHIMQEVQALCDRVIIINKGKIVADDWLKNLIGKNENRSVIVVEFKEPVAVADLSSLPGVEKVVEKDNRFYVYALPHCDVRPELIRFASDKNISLTSLRQQENSIEEIFRLLTTEATA
ncbi:MAG: gliding motility-associated ABC transporter ATP-binding subunit GldA [Bacteroidetes bacterium]|nr:gliding motility-associated ABC transporter ATP-binding subunit GldA [Bacteroidota bacterium]MBS1539290.1 gliding motility-associated ABC transporter ATP-binding subunit GldA [Bacteroidota bacterium]